MTDTITNAGVDPRIEAEIQQKLVKQLYHTDLFNRIFDKDYGFGISVISATPQPQKLVYMGLHQCYSDKPVEWSAKPNESESGDIAVKRLLEGGRGHFSPTEHDAITFTLEYTPHSVLQQLLRSRIGVSPSVQSFRYTRDHILEAANGKVEEIEKIVYLRPVGTYHDRETKYEYTAKDRAEDLSLARFSVCHVAKRIREGMPPEQARGLMPFDYRQHAVITFNARSLMGFFDRRLKKDAQLEIRILAEMMFEKFSLWMPEIAEHYKKSRYGKAILAP